MEASQKQVAQLGDEIKLLGEDGHGGVATYLAFRLISTSASKSRSLLPTQPASKIFEEGRAPRHAVPPVPFQLVLAGSAVVKGLPQSLRVIDGEESGLLVGRAHQRELHERAFVEGVLEYVSRDHFSIKPGHSTLLCPWVSGALKPHMEPENHWKSI